MEPENIESIPMEEWDDLLFPSGYPDGEGAIAILRAYFDESSTHEGAPSVAVAGCLSRRDFWKTFDMRWRHMLEREHLPSFHMTDFANSLGHFTGWRGDEARRRRVLAEVVEIMSSNVISIFWSAVFMADYNRLGDNVKKMYPPYVLCAENCLGTLGGTVRSELPGQKVAVIFGDGARGKGFVCGRHAAFRDNYEEGKVFTSFTFASPLQYLPLQAADVVAYEFSTQTARIPVYEPENVRWPLKQIYKDFPLYGRVCTSKELCEFLVKTFEIKKP